MLRPLALLIWAAATADGNNRPTCRVAFAYSGHFRSMARADVVASQVAHLVDGFAAECVADVFLYVDLGDDTTDHAGEVRAAPARDGDLQRAVSAFEASPRVAAVRAVRHADGAGLVPHNCSGGLPPAGAHAQLWKFAAVWRAVAAAEAARGDRYDWVVRARPDLGFMAAVPSARTFAADRVHVPAPNFFPMNDQLAFVPRAFAEAYFSVVRSFYVCSDDASRWYPPGAGAPESLLYKHLRDEHVPVAVVHAQFVIVRHDEGGRCQAAHNAYGELCHLLRHGSFGGLREGVSAADCARLVATFLHARCAAAFPPLPGAAGGIPPLADDGRWDAVAPVEAAGPPDPPGVALATVCQTPAARVVDDLGACAAGSDCGSPAALAATLARVAAAESPLAQAYSYSIVTDETQAVGTTGAVFVVSGPLLDTLRAALAALYAWIHADACLGPAEADAAERSAVPRLTAALQALWAHAASHVRCGADGCSPETMEGLRRKARALADVLRAGGEAPAVAFEF